MPPTTPSPHPPPLPLGSLVDIGGWRGVVAADDSGQPVLVIDPMKTWRHNLDHVFSLIEGVTQLRAEKKRQPPPPAVAAVVARARKRIAAVPIEGWPAVADSVLDELVAEPAIADLKQIVERFLHATETHPSMVEKLGRGDVEGAMPEVLAYLQSLLDETSVC